MARVVINNTRFNPFTFDEILKPLAMYAQEYKRQEDILDELNTKASVFDEMADEQKDPMAHKMYKSYANALRQKLDQLTSEGLSPASRKGLLEMKSRYSKEMVPIENAYKRREALATEQRQALANNPTLRYQRMANAMSLDDFINDPSIDYGYSYSGALLTKQVSDAATNLQRALLDKGKLESIGLPFQYQRMLQYGASPQQVMLAMDEQAKQGDSETIRFLRGIVDQVIDSSGVANWADQRTMSEFRAFANQGLYSAIGQAKIDNFTDTYSMQNALNAAQHRRQVQAAQDAENAARFRMYNIGPTKLYGASEIAKKNKGELDKLNRWRSLGYFNDRGQLTNKGWEALQYKPVETQRYDSKGHVIPQPTISIQSKNNEYDFVTWAKQHGVTNPSSRSSVNILNKYYQSTMAAINSGELVTGSPNIDIYRQSVKGNDMQTFVQDKITAELKENGTIYEVGELKEDSKGNVTMNRGKGLSTKKFKEKLKDNPILYVANSPYTDNQLIELTDGTMYILPKGVIDDWSQEIINTSNYKMRNAASQQEALIEANRANSYIGTLLNYNIGTGVSTNDGTIIY